MRIKEPPRYLEKSDELTSEPFRIQANAKAFDVLSDKLYSDKVAAVVRELSTNAADAHKAARQKKPFQVHLPNILEPHFSVLDWGTGLDDHEVKGIYTTYFDSNRVNSDEFTGCLGLGSKSPFSYIDQFAVESRFNGIKRCYVAFKDDHGVPNITLVNESPMDEPNGLEVKFPVRRESFDEFRRKAETVLSWFEPRPEVSGNSSFTWKERDYLKKTAGYGILESSEGYSHVIMGNVSYRVDSHELDKPSEHHCKIIEHGVDLFVPIGSVDIAASREKLAYTRATNNLLKDYLNRIMTDLKKEAVAVIEQAPTIWQARCALHKHKHTLLGTFLGDQVTWKGTPIEPYVDLAGYKGYRAEELSLSGTQRKNGRNTSRAGVNRIKADGTPIVLDDMIKNGFGAANYYLQTKNSYSGHIYYLTEFDESSLPPPPSVPGQKPLLPIVREPLANSGALETAIKTSTLPQPPPNSYVGNRRPKRLLLQWRGGHSSREGSWSTEKIDLSKGGVYVEVCRYKLFSSGPTLAGHNPPYSHGAHPSSLSSFLALLKILGHAPDIYGVRPADLKRIRKRANWMHFADYLHKVLDDNQELLAKVQEAATYDAVGYRDFLTAFDKYDFAKNSLFGTVVRMVREAGKAYSNPKVGAYKQLAINLNRLVVKDADRLEKIRKKTWVKYPLLLAFSVSCNYLPVNKTVTEAFTPYIRAVDAKKVIT